MSGSDLGLSSDDSLTYHEHLCCELEITKRQCTKSIRGVEKFKARKVKEIQEELAVDAAALNKVCACGQNRSWQSTCTPTVNILV